MKAIVRHGVGDVRLDQVPESGTDVRATTVSDTSPGTGRVLGVAGTTGGAAA